MTKNAATELRVHSGQKMRIKVVNHNRFTRTRPIEAAPAEISRQPAQGNRSWTARRRARATRATTTLLNTLSSFGVLVRQSGYGPYASSKAALINLTRALATECNPEIRVNAIAPGIVETEFLSGGTGREQRDSNLELDSIVSRIPMRRAGRPEDIAAMSLFLAGPAASYITAQTIHINGGLWS